MQPIYAMFIHYSVSAPVLNAYFQFHMFGIISDLFGSLPEHHAD